MRTRRPVPGVNARLLIILFGLLAPLACDQATGPEGSNVTEMRYWIENPDGSSYHELLITADRICRLPKEQPEITLTLSDAEWRSLADLFGLLESLKEQYGTVSPYWSTHRFSRSANGRTKQVTVGDSILYLGGPVGYEPTLIREIIDSLDRMYSRMTWEQSWWRLFSAHMTMDTTIVRPGEPVTFHFHVQNLSGMPQTLRLSVTAPVQFAIQRQYGVSQVWTLPPLTDTATAPVVLQPQEEKVFSYTWDQTYSRSDGSQGSLMPGSYLVGARMPVGGVPWTIWYDGFEVRDQGIPIQGIFEPSVHDPMSDFATRIFRLTISNPGSAPVTLHFPSEEKIMVTVYDGDSPLSSPVLYQGPPDTTGNAWVLVLEAGESISFSHRIPPDLRTRATNAPLYVVVRLRCTDFLFEQDGILYP